MHKRVFHMTNHAVRAIRDRRETHTRQPASHFCRLERIGGGYVSTSTVLVRFHIRRGPYRDSRKMPSLACSDQMTAACTLPPLARFREGARQRRTDCLSCSASCSVCDPSGMTLASRVHLRSHYTRPLGHAVRLHHRSCSRWWHLGQRHPAC